MGQVDAGAGAGADCSQAAPSDSLWSHSKHAFSYCALTHLNAARSSLVSPHYNIFCCIERGRGNKGEENLKEGHRKGWRYRDGR